MDRQQENRILNRINEAHSHILHRLEALEHKLFNTHNPSRNSKQKIQTIDDCITEYYKIIGIVCSTTGVSLEQLKKRTRKEEVANTRCYIWVLSEKYIVPRLSKSEMGRIINRKPSAVWHSINKFDNKMRYYDFRNMYQQCEKNIKSQK